MAARRIATRILDAHGALAALQSRGLGEDWVIPREPVRYLVVKSVPSGAVLTAFDARGRLVGERFAAAPAELEGVLDELHAQGFGEAPREIPPGVASALGYLDGEAPGEGGDRPAILPPA